MKNEPIPKLLALWQSLTKEGRQALATGARTSPAALYHVATGSRKASSERAVRIEQAAKELLGKSVDLDRSDIADGCRKCEYARRCKGSK